MPPGWSLLGPRTRTLPLRARVALAALVADGRVMLAALGDADYDVRCARPDPSRWSLAAAFGEAVQGR